MDVFDVQGKRVRRFGSQLLDAGEHALEFNGRDDDGRTLPSGVYFCRVTVGEQTTTRKVVIKR
jgi:flagellar hook assembly protein FlgD